jgi:ATP/maltotriose-dependent transcriptional regulator MalT
MLMGSATQNWIQGIMDARTERIYQESLELFQELGYKNGIQWTLCQLGQFAHLRGEHERAKLLLQQSLIIVKQMGKSGGYATEPLIYLSETFCGQGESERGTYLLGAVDEFIRTQYAKSNLYAKRVRMGYERALAAARAQLDEATFAAAYAQGQIMTVDQAVAYVLTNVTEISQQTVLELRATELVNVDENPEYEPPTTSNGAHPSPSLPDSLSERELEILCLIADGLNSREVSKRLTLSVGTIRWYLKLIYSKLNAHSRSEAIAHAKELKLLV